MPRTAAATIIPPTPPTTSNSINLMIVMYTWPTTSTTTVNLLVPSNMPNTMGIPSTPKPQTFKSWPRPYTPATFTDWSSDDNCDRTKRERENKKGPRKRKETVGRRKQTEKRRECHTMHT